MPGICEVSVIVKGAGAFLEAASDEKNPDGCYGAPVVLSESLQRFLTDMPFIFEIFLMCMAWSTVLFELI